MTIEEGVRVFRSLPPHDRVIINPDGKTPLNLGIYESRETSYSENHHHYTPGGAFPSYYGAWGNLLPDGRGHGRGHGQQRRGSGFPAR